MMGTRPTGRQTKHWFDVRASMTEMDAGSMRHRHRPRAIVAGYVTHQQTRLD